MAVLIPKDPSKAGDNLTLLSLAQLPYVLEIRIKVKFHQCIINKVASRSLGPEFDFQVSCR